MYGYIYKTTNLLNKKIYIGQKHSNKFLGEKYLGSGKFLKIAIMRDGKENFKVELIEEIESKDLMDEREIYWIKYYNSTNKDIGYNVSEGGRVNRTMRGEHNPMYGKTHNKIIRQFLSDINKGKHMNKEFKDKRSKYQSNTKWYNNGKKEILVHMSKEIPEGFNEGRLKNIPRKPASEETKRKISESNKGHKHTLEELKKMSLSQQGKMYINNGVIEKRISIFDTIPDGWQKGFLQQHMIRRKESFKNNYLKRVWINDSNKEKLISYKDLDKYTNLGFVKGRLKR